MSLHSKNESQDASLTKFQEHEHNTSQALYVDDDVHVHSLVKERESERAKCYHRKTN